MKLQNCLIALLAMSTSMSFVSCENGDVDFPDYEGGTTVYFSYQYPVRTLVLGADEYDTSMDKQHKCYIESTMGGAYGGRDVVLDVKVDPTLCNNLKFADGSAVQAMPESYYSLADNQILYNGEQFGKLEVSFTDAFFADPASAKNTYVIPLVIENMVGADNVLRGEFDKELYSSAPIRTDAEAWKVKPQDYVLYCVKYKSKYDAYWSRSGKYTVAGNTIEHPNPANFAETKGEFFDPVIDGEDCNTVTLALDKVSYHVKYEVEGVNIECDLILTFDGSNKCTITTNTAGVTVTGEGQYTENGAKLAWGNKDRDIIKLNYNLTNATGSISVDDQLVWKRSGVSVEEFSPSYVK